MRIKSSADPTASSVIQPASILAPTEPAGVGHCCWSLTARRSKRVALSPVHNARSPGPAALLSALKGRTSVAATLRLPATHQHPHSRWHHQWCISEHESPSLASRSSVSITPRSGISHNQVNWVRYGISSLFALNSGHSSVQSRARAKALRADNHRCG